MNNSTGRKVALIDLTPGDRIQIAGRRGTFLGYYRIQNFPNVIEWQQDGNLETQVTVWTQGGVALSAFDEDTDLSALDLEMETFLEGWG